MDISAKPAYHHGDLRQCLMDATIALMGEVGISDVSLRQVAKRLGVSHNAPYRHFADKDSLLAAIATQGFQFLKAAMETAQQDVPLDSAQRLTAIGMAYVHFALAHPYHYRLMFGDYRCNLSQDSTLADAAQQSFMVLVHTIRDGQMAGIFRVADPIDLARVAWSLVHGQSMLALDNKLQVQSPEEFEQFLHFSSHMLLQGFVASGAQARCSGEG